MQLLSDQLARSILKKNSLADCSMEELQQLVQHYPYFGVAQLLLTEKMRSESHPDLNDQIQSASLFFTNPLVLDRLMNKKGESEIISSTNQAANLPETPSIPEVPPAKEELVFEPYHTVDYFASQGIKFKADEKANDKFGQQLKSFTEWLKTLKKLPVQEIERNVDFNSEKKVEQLAENSIEDREVITEAMAAVWEKQGDTAKAIEIYTKLSLHNPSKSSYFAAKIEQLKKQ